jgi:ribosomal protein S18 acetylase RimI-like enzyme
VIASEMTFRTSREDDREWMFDLIIKTMSKYIAQTFGQWDEVFHKSQFDKKFQPSAWQVIVFQSEDIGILQTEDRPDTLWISNIQIDPRFQSKGIGSKVIRSLVDKAQRGGKSVTLRVFKVNPARALYERLGFRISGENETHWYMDFV